MAYKYTSYFADKKSKMFVPVSIGYSYNDFKDRPIKNLYGFDVDTFVVLSYLPAGRYNLRGYYRLDPYLELKDTGSNYYDVIISYDIETGNKVITFDTMENGVYFTNTVIYNEENRVQSTSHRASGLYWEDF